LVYECLTAKNMVGRTGPERPNAGAERLWLAEAERRLADLKSGKVAAIPAERVLKKVRAALR
jgi:hypothetical protein